MSENTGSARSRYEAARAAFDAAFERHLDAGVEFISKDGVCIDPEVEIAPGVLILPGTILRGKTVIGAGSVIGPDSLLEDAVVGENVTFNASQGRACRIGDGATIGPWVQLRPDSVIGKNVHIGRLCRDQKLHHRRGHRGGPSDLHRRRRRGQILQFRLRRGGGQLRRRGQEPHFHRRLLLYRLQHQPGGPGAGRRRRLHGGGQHPSPRDVPPEALGIARARQVTKESWAGPKLAAYIAKKQKLEAAARGREGEK